MAALTRKLKKIFAKDATINIDSGNVVFGSNADGTPVSSNDTETLESLSAFTTGFSAATIGGTKLPVVGEVQALKYDTDYHLAYIYQDGLQNYNDETEYFIDNYVRKEGTDEIWKSLTDDNVGNALVESVDWTFVGNIATPAATESIAGIAVLPKQITIANNVSDANNDIDFSAGNFQFSDGSGIVSLSALTKRLDAAWAAGTNQGGLFTGSKANSTWYHCFAIYNPTTGVSDCGFDTSVTAANIPSGYTKYKRVGSILTDGSGNILGFNQSDKEFIFTGSGIVDVSNVSQTVNTETLRTLTCPLGIQTKVLVKMNMVFLSAVTGTKIFNHYSPSITKATLNSNDYTAYFLYDASSGSVVNDSSILPILTDTSSRIKTNANVISGAANASMTLVTYGWIDYQL